MEIDTMNGFNKFLDFNNKNIFSTLYSTLTGYYHV